MVFTDEMQVLGLIQDATIETPRANKSVAPTYDKSLVFNKKYCDI